MRKRKDDRMKDAVWRNLRITIGKMVLAGDLRHHDIYVGPGVFACLPPNVRGGVPPNERTVFGYRVRLSSMIPPMQMTIVDRDQLTPGILTDMGW